MPDGSPVPVDTIMREFGVGRDDAKKIAARRSR
jgi:hypothetical protein